MKMIASTKLNRAQKAMEIGRTFGKTSDGKFDIEFEDDDIDDLGSTVKDVVDLILKVKARG